MAIKQVYHHQYINNVIGAFVRSMADYFRCELFPESNDVIIATYTKALQHYRQVKTTAGDKNVPPYPFLSIDPGIYDIEPEERIGRLLHGYPRFAANFAADITEPKIYQDDNLWIGVALNRYKSNMEVIVWCRSPYEVIDNRIRIFQILGGLDRPIYPKNISCYFILPDSLKYKTYTNRYTDETYQLDWANSQVENVLIRNINENKMCFPFTLNPLIKLTGASDASTRYEDSGEDISEYKLNLSFEWEVNLPTHLVYNASEFPNASGFSSEIGVGHEYVPVSSTTVPTQILITSVDGTSEPPDVESIDLELDEMYNYIFTEDDVSNIGESGKKFTIDLLRPIDSKFHVKVHFKGGPLIEPHHFTVTSSDPKKLILHGFNLSDIEVDDILTIIYYKDAT